MRRTLKWSAVVLLLLPVAPALAAVGLGVAMGWAMATALEALGQRTA